MRLCKKCLVSNPISEFRLTSNGTPRPTHTCKVCSLVYQRAWQAANRDKVRAANNACSARHREKRREYGREWYQSKRDKRLSQNKIHYNLNKESYLAKSAKRRALKKLAMPAWVDPKSIERIYRNRPKGYHVDHIVPLQGKNVSGLHVPWNLQYLLPSENLRKSNKYEDRPQ